MRQGSEAAGFGKLLARELSNKSDRSDASRAESADKNTGVQEGDAERITARDSTGEANISVNDGEDVSNPEDAKKSDSASVDSALPQLMDPANILPGLDTMQPAQVMGKFPAETRSHTHGEHRADEQLTGEAGDVSRTKSTLAEPSTDLPQAEQEGAIPAYIAFANQPLSLMPGNIAPASTGARPDSTVVQKGVPQLAGISAHVSAALATDVTAGVAAGLSSGTMAGVQNEAHGATRSAALQDAIANQFHADARLDSSMHLERSPIDSSFAAELTKAAGMPVDTGPQDPSAIQVNTGLLAVANERSLASASAPLANALDHSWSTLEPRLGSTGWDSALGQKIVWMSSQQQHVAELSLNPPDLGPLQIVLTVNNDQASAMFVSHNADVRQALETALPRLKEMMADSGISLGNTTIASDSSSQGASMEGFERRNHSGAHHAGSGGQANAIGSDGAGIARISIRGLVDTFA
jgi:flagellar hook-length control protein FliK